MKEKTDYAQYYINLLLDKIPEIKNIEGDKKQFEKFMEHIDNPILVGKLNVVDSLLLKLACLNNQGIAYLLSFVF